MHALRTNPPGALDAAADVLADAYRHVMAKPGKGVDHAREVARLLRAAGCDEPVQVAGLLHDVVEDTPRTIDDVRERFGPAVTALVAAVTEDDSITGYRRRKQALREQVARGGPAAIDIALADKIASLRYALAAGLRVEKRKLAHYRATLAMSAGAGHPHLAGQAAELLAAVGDREAVSLPVA